MRIRNYLAVLCAVAMPAFADDQALVIVNGNYQFTGNGVSPQFTNPSIESLRKAGYRVQKAQNLGNDALRQRISEFNASAEPMDHLVYVFIGHLLNKDKNTYLTPVDLRDPRADTIAQNAVDLNVILDQAGKHSGASAVFLGWTRTRKSVLSHRKHGFSNSPDLAPALGRTNIPQGVLLVDGHADMIADAIANRYFVAGRSTREVGNNLTGRVRSQGYLSLHSYLARNNQSEAPKPKVLTNFEQNFWDFAKKENSIKSYTEFLVRFPNGKYASTARSTLAQLQADAAISPEQRAERDLKLTRKEKQDIQRALTVLGHDTRGVDGLFGPASRRAIIAWQKTVNHPAHGFLDSVQVRHLLDQGAKRRRFLFEETERKRIATETQDRAFWQATGASGQEFDLRVYLNKYPDGLFAQAAQTKLDRILAEKSHKTDNSAEVQAWRVASKQNTITSYRRYLLKYQRGAFATEAKTRIKTLSDKEKRHNANAQHLSVENSMGLGKGIWLIVERKFVPSGLPQNAADGVVGPQTRKALRLFQSNNALPATGYMDPKTLSVVFFK